MSFLKNVLRQSAPVVFSCNIYLIVCPREVEIVTGEGLNELIESCLVSDRLFPWGCPSVRGQQARMKSYHKLSSLITVY